MRRLLHRFLLTAAALLALPALAAQPGATGGTPQVQATLLAHAPQGVAAGQPLWLAVRLQHAPGWHTYWLNPGDSGLATELQWQLPAGLEAGAIRWPVPERIPLGPLVNHGYEGTVLLPVPVTVSPAYVAGAPLDVQVQANWLACKTECIPEQAALRLRIPAQGSTALDGAAFDAAAAAYPADHAGGARITPQAGNLLAFAVDGLPAGWRGRELTLLPEVAAITAPAALPQQRWEGSRWLATLALSDQRSESPASLPLLLVAEGDAGAVRTTATLDGNWQAAPAAGAVSPALAAALAGGATAPAPAPPPPPAPGAFSAATLLAIAGALLGGLILNLMPCVLPVLAIKVLGFASTPVARRRAAGLAYTAGVVASFLALGGLLLALRAAGAGLGWGFQLQSPWAVAALAVLFTMIGLNLAGVFQVGSALPGGLAGRRLAHPLADDFFSGVLAVAVAAPCTAPFMGASLGTAAVLPAPAALAVFAALGLGMALPYLAAAWLPAAARWLPRPGAWMETFRRAMAFPMFATVVWLVWVVGRQSGVDGAAALLALLVAVSAVAWAVGLPAGRARRVLAPLAVVLVAGGAWLAVLRLAAAPTETQAEVSGRWQPWSAARQQELVAAGRPVFVDYTAAWCITCQVNKQAVLGNEALLADFAARGVTLLRADWTRRDPAITASLAALGRSGVPVYVLAAPGKPPVVLSELLSVAEVRGALDGLAR